MCEKTVFYHKIWVVAAIFWMAFIWSNSLETAVESSQKSSGFLELLTPLLSWTGLPVDLWHTLIRKTAHMAEFALLGLLWTLGLGVNGKNTKRLGWVLLICAVTALVDESIQLFVPGRSGELRDVCIDFCGAFLGTGLFCGLTRGKR